MEFGINRATAADSWKVVKRAEELGYAPAWFFDTQIPQAPVPNPPAVRTVAASPMCAAG